jgi:hypothetical protein
MNVRPVCVLRAASRPTTQAQVKSISFLWTSVYNEYSMKVSLKSLKNWGYNDLLNQI